MSTRFNKIIALSLPVVLAASSFFYGTSLFQATAEKPNQPAYIAEQSAPVKPAKDATKVAPKTTPKTTDSKAEKKAKAPINHKEYQPITPLTLVKEPGVYLGKQVKLEGVFNRFADVGLDYPKAFKDSKDYVNFMIFRPDVSHHKIPMPELKMYFPRAQSDEVANLEAGDTIAIYGDVFSTALSEPWVNVSEIQILKKTENPKKPLDGKTNLELDEQ